ncbi:MAG: adenylyl-sulfate kinase [Verrucomicrobiota bacterium]
MPKSKAIPSSANQKAITGQRVQLNGYVLWLTGLSGAGKSTIAAQLKQELLARGQPVCVLDGDVLRAGLCSDLGFSPADRKENIRRIGELAKLFAATGVICIVAVISPYRTDRRQARTLIEQGRFIEIYVNAPLEVCERRDPKGLYAKARKGEIAEFTGISSRYEPPEKPEIELHTDKLSITESVAEVLDFIKLNVAG